MAAKPKASEQQALSFLTAAWGSTEALRAGVRGRVGLFCLPSSASLSFDSLEDAAREAARLAEAGAEVYVRVTALREDYPAKSGRRGTVEDSVAVPGFAVDLDLQLPDRKKPRLFESIEEAQDVLDKLALKPTLTVASGGGLQAWWVLREPLELRGPEALAAAQRLARGWHETVLAAATRAGRTIDSTYDLARVMRLPGTFNNKRGAPVAVRIVDGPHGHERRYSPDDFETFSLAESEWVGGGGRVVAMGSVVEGLVLNPSAEPPGEKFIALMENEPGFKASWERKKRLPTGNSASEFDLSLASYAVAARWEDQEIVNLLIASRRKHGDDLKLREKYYGVTIAKAKSQREFDSLSAEIATSGAAGDDGRERVLRAFTALCGAELREVLVYMPAGEQWTFKFAGGRQLHCSLEDFATWGRFWQLLTAQRFEPDGRRPKDHIWRGLVSGVRQIATDVRVESSGHAARVADLCLALATDCGVSIDAEEDTEEEQRASALRNGGAFMQGGLLWVRLAGLVRIAKERRWDREYQREERLRAILVEELGSEHKSKNSRMKVRRRGRRAAADDEAGDTYKQINRACYGVAPERLREALGDAGGAAEGGER